MQDLPIDRLGPYPILQFAAAVLVIGGLALAIWRGTRDRKTGMLRVPDEQRWFFDGPLAVATNLLRDIRNHLERMVELNDPTKEEMRKQTDLLKDIKNTIDNIASRRRH